MTTSSMRMEIEAITQALKWVTTTRQAHVIFVTDSQSTLRKIESGNLRAEWTELLKRTTLKKITWIFTPGHAGVKGNERADLLAGKAKPEGKLRPDKPEIVRSVREKREKEQEELEYHHLERLRELGIRWGVCRKSKLSGSSRRLWNQPLLGTVSIYTLRDVLLQGTERLWGCPLCSDVGPSYK